MARNSRSGGDRCPVSEPKGATYKGQIGALVAGVSALKGPRITGQKTHNLKTLPVRAFTSNLRMFYVSIAGGEGWIRTHPLYFYFQTTIHFNKTVGALLGQRA